jgi:hypothetical protein
MAPELSVTVPVMSPVTTDCAIKGAVARANTRSASSEIANFLKLIDFCPLDLNFPAESTTNL